MTLRHASWTSLLLAASMAVIPSVRAAEPGQWMLPSPVAGAVRAASVRAEAMPDGQGGVTTRTTLTLVSASAGRSHVVLLLEAGDRATVAGEPLPMESGGAALDLEAGEAVVVEVTGHAAPALVSWLPEEKSGWMGRSRGPILQPMQVLAVAVDPRGGLACPMTLAVELPGHPLASALLASPGAKVDDGRLEWQVEAGATALPSVAWPALGNGGFVPRTLAEAQGFVSYWEARHLSPAEATRVREAVEASGVAERGRASEVLAVFETTLIATWTGQAAREAPATTEEKAPVTTVASAAPPPEPVAASPPPPREPPASAPVSPPPAPEQAAPKEPEPVARPESPAATTAPAPEPARVVPTPAPKPPPTPAPRVEPPPPPPTPPTTVVPWIRGAAQARVFIAMERQHGFFPARLEEAIAKIQSHHAGAGASPLLPEEKEAIALLRAALVAGPVSLAPAGPPPVESAEPVALAEPQPSPAVERPMRSAPRIVSLEGVPWIHSAPEARLFLAREREGGLSPERVAVALAVMRARRGDPFAAEPALHVLFARTDWYRPLAEATPPSSAELEAMALLEQARR